METLQHWQQLLDRLDDLRSIVKTMKALSAASIHPFEEATEALDGYYRTVELAFHALLRQHGVLPAMAPERPGSAAVAIVFGSDHGLCGRFNEAITARARGWLDQREGSDDFVIAVGARVAAGMEARRSPDVELPTAGLASRITGTVEEILLRVDTWRADHPGGPVHLFYNRNGQQGGHETVETRLLPVDLQAFARLRDEPWASRSLPVFRMAAPALARALVRQYLFVSLFRACAESQASEHASRLAAMQAAERNLAERIDEVTMAFRRSRQEVITSELLDVVSGYEALREDGGRD